MRVLAVHGDATVLRPGDAEHLAVKRDLRPADARLRTGPQSSALLEFDDGSRVMVRSNTNLRLWRADQPALDGENQVEIELLRGGLENVVKPTSAPATRFEIRSPAADRLAAGSSGRRHQLPDPAGAGPEVRVAAVGRSGGCCARPHHRRC